MKDKKKDLIITGIMLLSITFILICIYYSTIHNKVESNKITIVKKDVEPLYNTKEEVKIDKEKPKKTISKKKTTKKKAKVKQAKKIGLKAFALTDHDTTAGVKEAIECGLEEGVEVIDNIVDLKKYQM